MIYKNGAGTSPEDSSFLIDDFSLVQRNVSLTGKVDPATVPKAALAAPPTDTSKLLALGGRWFYEPIAGESTATPLTVTEDNADRLFYKSDRLINPFANNMTAWLRAGYLDAEGNTVTKDTFVPDNMCAHFQGRWLPHDQGEESAESSHRAISRHVRHAGLQSRITSRRLDKTYRLPLEPVLDPDAKVTDAHDTNHALPMGAIGVAVNGVVFYNPFDAGMQDASNIMDKCCGHPSPDNRYHYHKYPVCVNTPFVDKGDAPSEVIGFAFDGLPIYGPYQSAGVMAKDSTTNPLNAFNACYGRCARLALPRHAGEISLHHRRLLREGRDEQPGAPPEASLRRFIRRWAGRRTSRWWPSRWGPARWTSGGFRSPAATSIEVGTAVPCRP